MKKYLFLFAMMLMTSVSAYSQSQTTEEVIHVDIAVNAPGMPWCVWWRDVPLVIKDHGGIVELNLYLDGGQAIDCYHSHGSDLYQCIKEMTYYMNSLAPYFQVYEFYITPAGQMPFYHWY